VRASLTAVCSLMLLSACVSSRPDHFYILSALPQGAAEARPPSDVPAALKVTLPPWADRSEMLLNTSAGEVIVLEHERWAAPLAELVRQALALDIERRDELFSDDDVFDVRRVFGDRVDDGVAESFALLVPCAVA